MPLSFLTLPLAQAIKKYLIATYDVDMDAGSDRTQILKALRNGSKTGYFVKNGGSYKLSAEAKKKPRKAGAKKKKRSGSGTGGLQQPKDLSEELAEIVGAGRLSRAEVVKEIWVYIKANGLQDPKDKREILCDASLKKLFGVRKVNMFAMQKLLSPHIF